MILAVNQNTAAKALAGGDWHRALVAIDAVAKVGWLAGRRTRYVARHDSWDD
jgi:hypothetical protein